MKLSKHSLQRGDERTGLDPKTFEKLAGKALEHGVKHSDTTGRLHKYMDKLFFFNHRGNNIRIYGEHVYIFDKETLITVLHLPNNFKSLIKKIK